MPTLLDSVPLTLWQAIVDPRPCQRLPDTHRQAWISLLWEHCSFLLAPSAHKVLSVPSKSLFPQSCGSSIKNPTGLQSQIPWRFSVPLPDPQVGKSVVSPRTFEIVQELLWSNCSPVCGSSAQWLCSGGNGNLLQEDLCHRVCYPGLRH